MTKMIRADLRRVMRKKGFYILAVFLILRQIWDVVLLVVQEKSSEEIITSQQGKISRLYLMLITIYIIVALFGDDMHSNTPVSVIGRGMKRDTLVLGKMIDSALLISLFFVVISALKFFLLKLFSMPVSNRQLRLFMVFSFLTLLRGIACLVISLLMQLLTGSTAVAIIVDVVITMFSGAIFKFLMTLYDIGIYYFTMEGLVEEAFSNLSAGNTPWQIAPLVLVYICGVTCLAILVYRKKELEL